MCNSNIANINYVQKARTPPPKFCSNNVLSTTPNSFYISNTPNFYDFPLHSLFQQYHPIHPSHSKTANNLAGTASSVLTPPNLAHTSCSGPVFNQKLPFASPPHAKNSSLAQLISPVSASYEKFVLTASSPVKAVSLAVRSPTAAPMGEAEPQ